MSAPNNLQFLPNLTNIYWKTTYPLTSAMSSPVMWLLIVSLFQNFDKFRLDSNEFHGTDRM